MRIKAFRAENVPPIRCVEASDLSDIVVIAGPNGVGKTRLIQWLLQTVQSPVKGAQSWLQLEATSPAERAAWGKSVLDTRDAADLPKLTKTLQQNRMRSKQESNVLYFESNRSFGGFAHYTPTWDDTDPFAEMVNWNFGFQPLAGRFTDTVHSIFRKMRSRHDDIARQVERLTKASKENDPDNTTIQLDYSQFPDPIEPFRRAFSQLLAPKVLLDPVPREQQIYFKDGDGQRRLDELSSGEREVVNIVFDFLLRNPTDCITIFDEPELHLHPELSYRLLQTLRLSGTNNQFIFCTHSADIITAALDSSVIFIAPPRGNENQAIRVREDDETHQALRLIGQSIGIVALGRRLVLIEGNHTSLDKQTYGSILRDKFPNLVLVPIGGKETMRSFAALHEQVLTKTLWGVEFFMLCDRDAVPADSAAALEAKTGGRLRTLKRYHLENYFLDENIIAAMFADFGEPWLKDPVSVKARLKLIATEFKAYAAALIVASHFRNRVGNVDIMPKGVTGKSVDELTVLLKDEARREFTRVSAAVDEADITRISTETMALIEASFHPQPSSEDELAKSGDGWKALIPARPVLKVFCSSKHAAFDFGRFKIAYLKAAERSAVSPFEEIFNTFAAFDTHQAPVAAQD